MTRWRRKGGLLVPERRWGPERRGLLATRARMGAAAATPENLFETYTALSLTTNLEMCLDAGALASYSGSGQKWLDLSGNGIDFFRGADGGASTDDPTFNGAAGGLSSGEFWGFDGADFFRYDTTNAAWMNALHQDNAAFTLIAVVYVVDASVVWGVMATMDATGGGVTGGIWDIGTDEQQRWLINDGSGGAQVLAQADNALTTGAWNFIAVSLDEAAGSGGSFLYANGDYDQVSSSDTFDGTYTTPSASAADDTMEIGNWAQSAGNFAPNGTRMAALSAHSTNLSKADLDAIYARFKARRPGLGLP